jgi:hypothetical protein
VVMIDAWPSRSLTTWRSAPPANLVGGMGVPKIVDSRLESEVGGLAGRCPDAAAEPVARNVIVVLGGARDAGECAALGAPLGAVGGEGTGTSAIPAGAGRLSGVMSKRRRWDLVAMCEIRRSARRVAGQYEAALVLNQG